jgi:hypothetical protein
MDLSQNYGMIGRLKFMFPYSFRLLPKHRVCYRISSLKSNRPRMTLFNLLGSLSTLCTAMFDVRNVCVVWVDSICFLWISEQSAISSLCSIDWMIIRRLQNCGKRLSASSCPSVRMEQLDSHWRDFNGTWYLWFFRKSVKKIKIPLKSERTRVLYM